MGGVEAFNDCIHRLCQVEVLKHEEGTHEAITELESLARGHHIENKSTDRWEIPGSLNGSIAKTLIYGKRRKSLVDLEIEEIKEVLNDFATQVQNEKELGRKQYQDKKKEIAGK